MEEARRQLFERFLKDVGCGPLPPGDLVDVVFRGATADIYAELNVGWFWWSGTEWETTPPPR